MTGLVHIMSITIINLRKFEILYDRGICWCYNDGSQKLWTDKHQKELDGIIFVLLTTKKLSLFMTVVQDIYTQNGKVSSLSNCCKITAEGQQQQTSPAAIIR